MLRGFFLPVVFNRLSPRYGWTHRNESAPSCLQNGAPYCDPAGIRTQDPYIKSVLLYQLSYRIIYLYLGEAFPALVVQK